MKDMEDMEDMECMEDIKDTERKKDRLERAYDGWTHAVDRAFHGKSPKERVVYFTALIAAAVIQTLFPRTELPYTGLSVGSPLSDAFLVACGTSFPGALAGAVYVALRGAASVTFPVTSPVTVTRLLTLFSALVTRLAASLWFGGGRADTLFREPAKMKMGVSLLLVLTQSAIHTAENGVDVESARAIIATLLATPILTALFLPFFGGCPVRHPGRGNFLPRAVYEVSTLLFFSAVCYASRDTVYAGCRLGTLVGLFLTAVCAERGGAVRGSVTGFLLGSVAAPAFRIPFAVLGGVYGIFSVLGSFPSAGIAAFSASAVAVFTGGPSVLLTFVPETVLSFAVTTPVIRYSFLPPRFPYPKYGTPDEAEAITVAETRALETLERKERLLRIAGAFGELSETMKSIGTGVPELSGEDAEGLARRVRDEVCATCTLEPVCWLSEAGRTSESIQRMILEPEKEREDSYVGRHCIRRGELRKECARRSTEAFPSRMPRALPPGREYGALSEILYDVADDPESEYVRDGESEKAVFRASDALGFRPASISVVGGRKKRVYAFGVTPKPPSGLGERLREAFSAACGTEFEAPVYSSASGGCVIFRQAEKFACSAACVSRPKAGEKVNGDAARSFVTPDGKYYSVITDGMGSGSAAGESATLACGTIEKLLLGGIGKRSAVRLAGDVVYSRGNEVFSTVDLAEIDLISGRASFVKSGAAASYVSRGGSLYCISGRALPVGITEDVRPEEITFELVPGDRIIMVSDGVIPAEDESGWLSAVVSGSRADGERLASRILEKAVSISGDGDDMTVTVITVSEKPPATSDRKRA